MINGFEIGEAYVLNRQIMLFIDKNSFNFKHLLVGDIVIFLGKTLHDPDYNEFRYRFLTKHGVLHRLLEVGDADEWFEKL